jgi:hypothetical protein
MGLDVAERRKDFTKVVFVPVPVVIALQHSSERPATERQSDVARARLNDAACQQ